MKAIVTQFSIRDGGHYVPGMEHNGVLYISGQLSIDPVTGEISSAGVGAETTQALTNMDLVLTEAGLTRSDVVMCRLYTPDVQNWPEINEAYSAFFGDHKPARVVVPSNNLYGGCLVEIEAIADATTSR